MPKIIASWKQKIDPFFDKPIKGYVWLLAQIEKRPNDGQLNLPDDYIESIRENPEWQDFYKGEVKESVFDYFEELGLLDRETIKIFYGIINADGTKSQLKLCFKMIEALPEKESRAFYLSELENFHNKQGLRPDFDLSDKNTRDYFSIVLSLLLRYVFEKMQGEVIQLSRKKEEQFKNSDALITLLGFLFSTYSDLANYKNLMALIKSGNDLSLFKAIAIDKRLLYTEEVKSSITKAQLSGDTEFFKKLSKAIARSPLKSPEAHGKTYAVLNLFWCAGLYKLTNPELHSFLVSCGLIPPALPYAFEKFVKRYIRSFYSF